jgi:hypothetical protein
MDPLRPVLSINIAAVPVRGVGGFFLLLAAIVGMVAFPRGIWYIAAVVSFGVVLAGALVAYRRHTAARGSIPDVLSHL